MQNAPRTPAPKQDSARLGFVDTLRGLAVVFMILWHTVDSWLTPEVRDGATWSTLRLLGGLAAPSFVLLAGAGVGLKMTLTQRSGRDLSRAARGLITRGVEIAVLGYLLRLQFWAIDSAGAIQPNAYRAVLPLAVGYGLVLWALKHMDRPRIAIFLLVGIAVAVLGYTQIEFITPGKLLRVLRVDILQTIGVSLVCVTLLMTKLPARSHGMLLAVVGAVVACSTYAIAEHLPGPLPLPLAGYLGVVPVPAGQSSITLFPLFPWMAYAFAGAAAAVSWVNAGKDTLKVVAIYALVGLAVAIPVAEWWHHTKTWMDAWPWIVQPLRVLYRVGIVFSIALIAYGIDRAWHGLRTFGQTSLLIYWVHLEFAFGLIATPLKKSLNLSQWLVGFTVLTLAMYALARFRMGPLERWLIARRST